MSVDGPLHETGGAPGWTRKKQTPVAAYQVVESVLVIVISDAPTPTHRVAANAMPCTSRSGAICAVQAMPSGLVRTVPDWPTATQRDAPPAPASRSLVVPAAWVATTR